MATKLLTALALALLLATPAFAQGAAPRYEDKIVYLDDEGERATVERVEVKSATYREVTYELRGGRKAPARDGSKVLRISYYDEPGVYSTGVKNQRQGRYEAAASDFDGAKNAVAAGRARPWLLEYANVRKAQALTALARTSPGKAEEAVAAYRDALKANPESLLFDEIQLGLAEAFSLDKRWNDAKNAAEKLLTVGKQIKHPVWQALGQKAIADTLVAEGKYTDAVNIYRDLVLLARREHQYADGEFRKTKLKDLETLGAVEQGWALVAWAEESGSRSDWNKAKSHFESILTQYPGSEVVAAAVLNGVGRALMEEDPRAALMKFIQAEVVHYSARDEVARALWLKAKALKRMDGATNRAAAEAALAELERFYPDSVWAKKKK